MKVSVLGTGAMGAGMARSLRRAGLDVVVWNRTRAKAEPLREDGIEVANSVAEAVTGADFVVTMVFDLDAVLETVAELTGSLRPDALWLQSSTVGPQGMDTLAAASGDAHLLDAPMLGTKQPAEQGKLVALVSGPRELVERARPVLDALGSKTVVAGDQLGDASALKLACNAWVLSLTAATAQSVALADALGVGGAKFLEAIAGGPTDTPYAQLKGGAMLSSDFTPSFGLDGGLKDLGLIADAARAAEVDSALVDSVRRLFDTASSNGHGAEDIAAVLTSFSDSGRP